MSWVVAADELDGIITVSLSDEWNLSQAGEALRAMWSTRAQTRINRVLWDVRKLASDGIRIEHLRQLANSQLQDRPELPGARAAVVVRGDLEFGFGRVIGALIVNSPVEFEVFRDHGAAVDWLTDQR